VRLSTNSLPLRPAAEAPASKTSPPVATMHDLVSAAAARWPDRQALRQDGLSVTYAALEAQSDAVCAYLRGRGVRAGSTVVVWLERCLMWPAALLGIAKAGAAYLPVDVRDPRERLEYVLTSAAANHILGSRASGKPPAGTAFVAVEDACATARPRVRAGPVHPSALAYILYTSGTTGRPKGVGVSHANLVHTVEAVAERYALGPGDRVLQFSALTFDVAAEELFASLIRGATVVLRPAGPPPDIAELVSLIRAERLSVVNLPASYWHQWASQLTDHPPASCPELRLVVVGSEPVDSRMLAAWQAAVPARVRWLNAYGTTETTITATVHEPPTVTAARCRPPADSVPIGRPLPGVRAYVLDAALGPVAPGTAGELYLGGRGVSRGYVGDPALTAARFRPDPWGGPGDRMFATGDRVRRTASGALQFLGRSDDQIKVRGFRIEPGEIEHVLKLHPHVADAVVVRREDRPGDQRLIGYVTCGPGDDGEELVAELRSLAETRLPAHMVPGAIIVLKDLQLTPHGKIDRRALPAPVASTAATGSAPRSPAERRLAAIWSDVLGRPVSGVDDDFFSLGGHSLLAMQVVTRARREFQVDIPVRALFDHPTIAGLAAEILGLARGHQPAADGQIPVSARPNQPALSFAQQRTWFMQQLVPDSSFFNVAETIQLTGPLDVGALQAALDGVVARHEVLRTCYPRSGGQPYQSIAEGVRVPLTMVAARDEEHAQELLLAAVNEPFDLAVGPIIRAGLIRLAAADPVLWISVHHIAFDEWSDNVLLAEISALYSAWLAGRRADLAPLPLQYADFAAWHRDWVTRDVRDRQLGYWREQLAGAPQALALPTDKPRPRRLSHLGASLRLRLDVQTSARLRGLALAERCTPFMVLLTLFGILLSRYGAGEDIPVATPVANRTRQETEALIGLFFNTLVLRLDLSGQPGFLELLGRTRKMAIGAYDHQDLPFEQLVEDLRPVRDPSRNPLAQVLFQLHSERPGLGKLDLPGITATPFEFTWTTSRLDLEWHLRETAGTFTGIVTYATELFERETIANLIRDFAVLAAAVAAAPDCSLLDVPLTGAGRNAGNGEPCPSGDRAAGEDGAPAGDQPGSDRAEICEVLCSLWAVVLDRDRVGADDDFFDLGGHSLAASRLIARIDEAFGVRLPLSELFDRPTVSELAEAIAELGERRHASA